MWDVAFLVAKKYNYVFCTDFNKKMLQMQGLSEDDLGTIEANPSTAPLEDKEKALLGFVMKVVTSG